MRQREKREGARARERETETETAQTPKTTKQALDSPGHSAVLLPLLPIAPPLLFFGCCQAPQPWRNPLTTTSPHHTPKKPSTKKIKASAARLLFFLQAAAARKRLCASARVPGGTTPSSTRSFFAQSGRSERQYTFIVTTTAPCQKGRSFLWLCARVCLRARVAKCARVSFLHNGAGAVAAPPPPPGVFCVLLLLLASRTPFLCLFGRLFKERGGGREREGREGEQGGREDDGVVFYG